MTDANVQWALAILFLNFGLMVRADYLWSFYGRPINRHLRRLHGWAIIPLGIILAFGAGQWFARVGPHTENTTNGGVSVTYSGDVSVTCNGIPCENSVCVC